MNRKLTDIELYAVCEVIASCMGLHFPVERWAILDRNLASAAREFGFQNMGGFIQWLLSATLNKEQMEILAAHLTISETYFWREPQVFTALTDFILPELIRSKGKEKVEELATKSRLSGRERSIRIWSAGCSTGEEPYSIAIALHKTIKKIEDWNITILATDINPKALDKAEHGIYSTWSFRNSPSWLKSSYFHHKEDRQYEIIPEIKKMVTFTCLSLVEMSALSNASTMDIIFCRNVLMYFTNEWVNKISQNLFNSLSEEGWLIVSSCELSSNLFPQFTPVNFPGAVLYRKGKNGSVHSSPSISYETERIQPLSAEASAKVDLTPSTFTRHSLVAYAPKLQQRSGEGGSSTLHQPPTNVKPPEESITDKLFAIRLLADQGFLSESLSLCNKTIASDKLAPGLYFMRASILQEMGKSSEAIASLRQGIYINPDNVMGHFILGNLFIRMGNTKNSKRSFKNVLDLLNGSEDDDILPDSEGLSVKYIREIIHANMQTQQRNEKRNPYQT